MTAPNDHEIDVDTLGDVLALAETALRAAAAAAAAAPRDERATSRAARQVTAARFRQTARAVAAMGATLPPETLAWSPPAEGDGWSDRNRAAPPATLEDILLHARSTLRLLETVTRWQRCAVRCCDELATAHPDALAALDDLIGRDADALDALMSRWPGRIANWRPGGRGPAAVDSPAP